MAVAELAIARKGNLLVSSPQIGQELKSILYITTAGLSGSDWYCETTACYLFSAPKLSVCLCLDIELSVPQTLDDQLVALCTLVDVLDIICE
jgi:hypothetical protein